MITFQSCTTSARAVAGLERNTTASAIPANIFITPPNRRIVQKLQGFLGFGGKISTGNAPSLRGLAGTFQVFHKGAVVTIRFGPFVLDLDTRQLTRDAAGIHISPKAFELLVALVLERPKVLSKAVLQQRLWPETFVAEA